MPMHEGQEKRLHLIEHHHSKHLLREEQQFLQMVVPFVFYASRLGVTIHSIFMLAIYTTVAIMEPSG